ncbi:MAG: plasmid pRiA4b ORF-3 family protein [Spirochaetaceae bacterium]|jgi:hypothetical protein|nr:plasmid pRiA4b ORF-3 family protein [Spirochaetaceae bacterium]
MTANQEDALYDFLENVTEPFTLEDVAAFIRLIDPKRKNRLETEIAAFIDSRNVAFRLDNRHWVSRRGCFEPIPFVISPTRLELLNGILIPGHRCIPFANPELLPQKYVFYWKGSPIPATTTEGPPEDFYPYYCLFGEEYASQYVARDNPGNESAYNSDPYEDPPEVSIATLDMRNIYRETSFVPGDRFVARTRDWKAGEFELERVGKDEWAQADLYAWFEAAESGFEDSLALLGPGSSTEEQIAYAYWYGGKRMRDIPAYALEDFLYEKTDRIETVPYGIETRFWYAGKEIPDNKDIEGIPSLPDQTMVEDILFRKKIPISEFVVQSYVRDALFRNDGDIPHIINRIVPPVIHLEEAEWDFLADYISDALDEFYGTYSLFTDQGMGPIRQRVGELHTAVIDLAARLHKGDIDSSWLPKHTFIVLSQIQGHAAGLLEDLDTDEPPPEAEMETMDNTLDSMIETYEDIKELIGDALDSFRRNNLSVVRPVRAGDTENKVWRTVQISVGGVDVWRRVAIPESCRLEELHLIIQILLDWKDNFMHRFSVEMQDGMPGRKTLDGKTRIGDLASQGVAELAYEYGTKWMVRIIILSREDEGPEEAIRCVAGAGAPPPELVEGPLRFRKILAALEKGSDPEKQAARHEVGADFDPGLFDRERYNRKLRSHCPVKKPGMGPVKKDF